jgi:hypothetical protein
MDAEEEKGSTLTCGPGVFLCLHWHVKSKVDRLLLAGTLK